MAHKKRLDPLPILKDKQAAASAPTRQVRLSASAGTGKTQVLSARVLRLLLHDVKPEAILCLTFTKAGAAEMADRIHERLGGWVTMSDRDLKQDLFGLGEQHLDNRKDEARNLFAKVLDARGSGLRIQTIHSFCQTLLGSFPIEAGLPPGFRAIEAREEEQLAAKALSDLVEGFERDGRLGDLDRLKRTAKYLSEDATRNFLRRCASSPEVFAELESDEALAARVRRMLSNGIDDIEHIVLTVCDEGGFDRAALEKLKAMNEAWLKKDGSIYAAGLESADLISSWLAAEPAIRVETLANLQLAWLTVKRKWREKYPPDGEYRELAERLNDWVERLIELVKARNIAPIIADALRVGKLYADAYAKIKHKAGVVDFSDLIRSTVNLLQQEAIGDWVRFKLDQSIDHILVDEAQDTNEAQWDIVKKLAEEFFAGSGAKDLKTRTIFKVGDFKQAIFGFQGTDPRQFEEATQYFQDQAEAAGQSYEMLSLAQSYRSSQPILDTTDKVIELLGHGAFGLPGAPDKHQSASGGIGTVTLLEPVSDVSDAEHGTDEDEPWIGEAELKWARRLSQMIKGWVDGGLRLRNKDRAVEPQDIMILVRSRKDLARLIISRLHEMRVPVAGIDRLQLAAPIAVQDLLACIRFVLQPEDDLSLAALLASPLIGWSQDKLYDHAKKRKLSLWQHLGDAKPAELRTMLARADRSTPYQFLESILSDPEIEGRKRLIGRLGEEARDPIEELLNQALLFEEQSVPSLQLFIDWFDRGEVEIKRDPSKPENLVRVMTVHGAKGLQAPIVILADATSDPEKKKSRTLDWEPEEGLHIPLFRPRKADRMGSLEGSAKAQDARELEEHWRLLYVAMTRAEEYLFVGGALKKSQQGRDLGDGVWYKQVARALTGLGAEQRGQDSVLECGKPPPRKSEVGGKVADDVPIIPDWALLAAPQEAKPPRPLVPSALESSDSEPSPPPTAERQRLARRGILLHSLFERLPAVPRPEQKEAALRWLEHTAGVINPAERDELATSAINVIVDPLFAEIFGANALAETPLVGVVGSRVISGTVDRLLIRQSEVLVVDFKTGRRVPTGAANVHVYHKAQMAAYAAVLQSMFADKPVRAALLYTSGPKLIELPAAMLEDHKPGFMDAQQHLPYAG